MKNLSKLIALALVLMLAHLLPAQAVVFGPVTGGTGGGSGGSPTGAAGGDLGGTYPNPVVQKSTNSTFAVTTGVVTIGSTVANTGVALDVGSKTSSILLPLGTTGTRPATGINGMLRYNSTTPAIEGYVNNAWTSLGAGSGSGTVNTGAANQVPYYAASGTTVSPATLGNNLAIVSGVFNTTQPADRLVTTATDTITATDCGTVVAYNRATSIAVGIAAASSTGLTQGCTFTVNNYGAGTATITPTTSTINGASTLAIPSGTGCLIRSDSTNYKVDLSACSAVVVASGAVSSVTGDNFYFGNTLSTGAVTLTQKNHTANTVTGSLTATVNSDLAVPSCSSASSALTWTSGTGFGCNTISGSGTVNAGTQYQIGYYATSTTAISGNSAITTDASNNLYVTTGSVAIGSTLINTGVSLDLGTKTNSMLVPKGTTGQEPTGIEGMLRYNTTTHGFEGYQGVSAAWGAIGSGSAVSISPGSSNIITSPNPITGTGTVAATNPINAQTGTTYTIVTTDMGKTVTMTNAAATAVTLPVATTTGFTAGAAFSIVNEGAGIVTITPTTSTINGLTTLVLIKGASAYIMSDGTNYFALYFPSPYVAGNTGTKFTTTGCSVSSTTGGPVAGTYTSGTTGSCATVITMGNGVTAPNGWSCPVAGDQTTASDLITQTATTATTATLTGTTVSGDIVRFGPCVPY